MPLKKKQPVSAGSRNFNPTGKGLTVFVRNVNTSSFLKKILFFFGQQECLRSFMVAGDIQIPSTLEH
jgi:hypothetical protein